MRTSMHARKCWRVLGRLCMGFSAPVPLPVQVLVRSLLKRLAATVVSLDAALERAKVVLPTRRHLRRRWGMG